MSFNYSPFLCQQFHTVLLLVIHCFLNLVTSKQQSFMISRGFCGSGLSQGIIEMACVCSTLSGFAARFDSKGSGSIRRFIHALLWLSVLRLLVEGLAWGCQPEHLPVAFYVAWASSQHGAWLLRASVQRDTSHDLASEATQHHSCLILAVTSKSLEQAHIPEQSSASSFRRVACRRIYGHIFKSSF